MAQLLNFIPKTFSECRKLLKELSENREGIALADRNGRIDALNAEEIKTLIGLIEKQIGEKAPAPAPKEASEPAPTKKTSTKKASRK